MPSTSEKGNKNNVRIIDLNFAVPVPLNLIRYLGSAHICKNISQTFSVEKIPTLILDLISYNALFKSVVYSELTLHEMISTAILLYCKG